MKMKSPDHSRHGRLFCCLISLVVALGMARQAEAANTTTVQDVVYRADGTPAAGTLVISWPAFTTSDNSAVAAGSMSLAIGAQGAISVTLMPNAGGTPDGTYYRVIYKLDDGSTSEEYWAVPATQTTTIGAVRSKIIPTGVAMQVASRQYVDSAMAAAVKLCTAPNAQTCIDALSSTGGTVYLAAGTYTGAITLPDNGNCVNLVGAGIDLTVLTVSSPVTGVVSKSNNSLPLGCRITDLTIDGNLQATYGMQLQKGKGWQIQRVKVRRVLATTGEGIVLGESSGSSAEFYDARIRDIAIAFESGDYASNARPLNGLHFLATATDNQVSDVTAWSMSNAGILDDAGDNQYNKVHVYGFPLLTYYPNYAMEVLGNAHITQLTADGVSTAGVHVKGNGNSVTNSTFQWPTGGQVSGAFPIVADAGTDYNLYRDNVVRGGSGLAISGLAAVFAKIGTSYLPGYNTEISGNTNYGDSADGTFANFPVAGYYSFGQGSPRGAFTFISPFAASPTIVARLKASQTADFFDCLSADASATLCSIDNAGNATFARITGPLTGNASTATALASTPSQCSSGQYSTGITASGNANCSQVGYSQLSGTPPSLPPSGSAGGDLAGSYPNPTVAQVNGASVPTSATFVGTNSSGQLISQVAATRVAATSLTGQTASIGNTTLYTPSSAGTYRVVLAMWTMTAGSSGTVSFSLSANTGSGAESFGSSSLDLTKVNSGGQVSGQWNIHVAASQAISYNTTLTCSSCGSPQYGIDVVVERLQ